MCLGNAAKSMAYQVMSEVADMGQRMRQDFKGRGRDTSWEYNFWQRVGVVKDGWMSMAQWRGKEMKKGRQRFKEIPKAA
jgi:hypothetical protein